MKHSSSSKGKLAPSAPVADPQHINRGPAGTKISSKGALGKFTSHPNHKSKVTRSANIISESRGSYPSGMKGTSSVKDKSNPIALPAKNRSSAGKASAGRSKNLKGAKGNDYDGPSGMKGSGNSAQKALVSGAAGKLAK